MHPDLYLVLYRQQERELERRLNIRAEQTCCAALVAPHRQWHLPFVARPAAGPVPVCCVA